MSLHLLDLRPIKGLSSREKATLPVSIALLPDGSHVAVSCFGDDVWDFYPYIPQENLGVSLKRINWRIGLPCGRTLTDPQYAGLLESAKDFIWSLLIHPVEGRKRPSMNTLISKVKVLIPLLRWMVSMNLPRFADLDRRTLDYVPIAKRKDGGGLAGATLVGHRLLILEDLYCQRDKLNDAPSLHPWPQETSGSLAGQRWGLPKTEFIPDIVVNRLTETALDYVNTRSAGILLALENRDAAAREKSIMVGGTDAPKRIRTTIARAAGFRGTKDLDAEGIRLRTACYIVIALFSGIRDSEMASLGINCISHDKSGDCSTDLLWLHGTIYKTGMRDKKWLVPPIVSDAVTILTRLGAPLRDALRQEEIELELHIAQSGDKNARRWERRRDTIRRQKDSLFLAKKSRESNGVSVISSVTTNLALKRFCRDFGIVGADGLPYPLHTHQFRRTYARFIARSELGDLLTLRDHFGHWSLDMTAYYADGGVDVYEADTQLMEMITEEKMVRQNEIMTGYLASDTLLANGGHWLQHWRSAIRTAANKEELIAEYAGSITLNGTGHSWCVGNAKGTGCGGLCVFEAQMCVDCKYGIIGQEHRPVWQGIREQQQEALMLNDMGIAGKLRAQRILADAEKVLRRLDGTEIES